jgi:hypothetical protein
MEMPITKREERQRVRGLEVQERLRKLQGQSRNDLVADKARGHSSPLGKRQDERRKGR